MGTGIADTTLCPKGVQIREIALYVYLTPRKAVFQSVQTDLAAYIDQSPLSLQSCDLDPPRASVPSYLQYNVPIHMCIYKHCTCINFTL